jgi:2-polyprenyl-3-methyl-5-hydroxy-6-metoxy-1,4-benzoquinol methylase
MIDDKDLLKQQIEYYRARASEYDEWFFRIGRYDREEKHRQQWFAEIESVRKALKLSKPSGKILELACGTGLWTEYLAPSADRLLAIDVSPEMIEINRQRLSESNLENKVEYIIADLFFWSPTEKYDFIFFGFWLSHVPQSEFDNFWDKIRKAVKPTGKVFFVDSLLTQESTAKNHTSLDNSGRVKRKLNSGRAFEIIKQFYEPEELVLKINRLGWKGQVKSTDNFFLYGSLTRKDKNI